MMFFLKILKLANPTNIIAAVAVITVLWGGIKIWEYRAEQRGAQELSDKLKANDTKTLKDKVKNDAELSNKPLDDLLDEFPTD